MSLVALLGFGTVVLLAMVLLHSYLWWRGQMASSGELRYLLVTAPLWGVIGARGWERAFSVFDFQWRWGG